MFYTEIMLKMKRNIVCMFLVFLTVSFAVNANAISSEQKGLEITEASERASGGWIDLQSKMKMVVRNSRGQERERIIKIKILDHDDVGNRSLTIFDSPPDIKGTALLNHSHLDRDDDQWLYLPGLKRTKRISASGKTSSFMGSDFTFEDFESFEVEKYTYSYIEDIDIDGNTLHKVEQYPKSKSSGYSRRVVLIDSLDFVVTNVEFFNKKDELIKTLVYQKYQKYDDKYWRAGFMSMTNHESGGSTDLIWSGFVFNKGLLESEFNKSALKRTR